jgi:hypothetical protein
MPVMVNLSPSSPGIHPQLRTSGSYPIHSERAETQTHVAGGAGGSKAAALRLLPRRVETVVRMIRSAPSLTGSSRRWEYQVGLGRNFHAQQAVKVIHQHFLCRHSV